MSQNDSLILLSSIKIADRNNGQLFFNPRNPSAFTRDRLAELYASIRLDGLLESPIVREYGDGHQLLAGERRYRTICHLVEDDVYCYSKMLKRPAKWGKNTVVIYRSKFAKFLSYTDDQNCEIEFLDEEDKVTGQVAIVPIIGLRPTAPASEIYDRLSCNVIPDCDDEWAMRIAMAENHNQEPLPLADEIELCERLEKLGKKQQEICEIVGKDPTWVCHTLNFRKQLPQEAFDSLVENRMVRHVAVQFFKYPAKYRKNLLQMAKELAQEEHSVKSHQVQEELNELEDLQELHEDMAEHSSTPTVSKSHAKKAKHAAVASKKVQKKKQHLDKEAGHIHQGHVEGAAVKLGLRSKTPKCLSRKDIETIYVQGIDKIKSQKVVDPLFEIEIPKIYLAIVQATAQGILTEERNPLILLRNVLMDEGIWKIEPEDGLKSKTETIDTDEEYSDAEGYSDSEEDEDLCDDFEFDPDSYEDDDDYDGLTAMLGQDD